MTSMVKWVNAHGHAVGFCQRAKAHWHGSCPSLSKYRHKQITRKRFGKAVAAPTKILVWSYCACISVTNLRFTETWIIGEAIEISTNTMVY